MRRPAAFVLMMVLACGAAAAPSLPPPPGAPAQPAARTVSPETRASWAVERVTLLDLRMRAFPAEADYRIADLALAVAMRLDPSRPDLVRKRIEACWNAGFSDRAFELTKDLIRLDPKDTVAQLRLISGLIGRRQTAAERMDLYKKFVASPSVDPSVRSRLATDAALLAREMDDRTSFREYLKTATILDSTNKEAAVLACTSHAQDKPEDEVGKVELLSNLLMADPIDPLVHLTLASELGRHGCFEQANRMHGNARALLKKTGGEITQQNEVEALVLEWQVDGPEKVLGRINQNLASQRKSIADYNASVRDQGIGRGQDLGEPEDLRLGSDTEKVRLATAIASENTDAAKASLLDMTRSVDYMATLAKDDAKRPLGITREEAGRQAEAAALDLQFWRVMAGLDLDKVEEALKALTTAAQEGQVGPDIVRAILKLRQGRAAEALLDFDGIIAKLPEGQLVRYTTEYVRGQALEALNRKDEAMDSYRLVQRGAALKPIGAISRFRLEKIAGGRTDFSPHRKALQKIAEGIPPFVDEMIARPASFMTVLGEAPRSGEFGDDAPLTITLRNVAPIPLAVGSDRPINSRFMFSPALTGRAARLGPVCRPEILELDQRLRLDPRETLTAPVHPDLGYSGFVMDVTCDSQARFSWKIVQGFTPGKAGNFVAGPLSLATESSPVIKNPIPDTKIPVSELTSKLGTETGDALYRALLAVRQRLWADLIAKDLNEPAPAKPAETKPPATPAPAAAPGDRKTDAPKPAAEPARPATAPANPPAESAPAEPKKGPVTETTPEDRVQIGKALAARYPSLPPAQRLLIAAMMPLAGQAPECAALDAEILADQDPQVRFIALLTRVSKADDPALAEAAKSSDPALAELAALLTSRLAQSGMTYSRLTAGLEQIRAEEPVLETVR